MIGDIGDFHADFFNFETYPTNETTVIGFANSSTFVNSLQSFTKADNIHITAGTDTFNVGNGVTIIIPGLGNNIYEFHLSLDSNNHLALTDATHSVFASAGTQDSIYNFDDGVGQFMRKRSCSRSLSHRFFE